MPDVRAVIGVSTFKEKLSRARKPRRTVDICLAGDLVAEFAELEKQLKEATKEQAASYSLEDTGGAVELAERMEALRQEIREQVEPFVIQGLPGTTYRALKAQFPPREREDGQLVDSDRQLNTNVDDLAEPLIRACLVEPELDDQTWAETMEALTDGQWEELFAAAILVNEGRLTVPFSRAASAILQTSAHE